MAFTRPLARVLFVVACAAAPLIAGAAEPLEVLLAFQPASIGPGETSSMIITITNPNAIAATNLSLSDTYPGGILNTGTPDGATTCGGTVTAAPGSHEIAMTGGTLGANATCDVTVNVTAFSGLWVNAIDPGSVTSSSVPANTFFSTALLEIVMPPPPPSSAPAVAMMFAPAAIHAGKTTTLKIAVTNPNGAPMSGVSFTTDYPQALINTPSGATSSCGGTVSAKPGSRSVAFSGGTIPAGGTCTVAIVIRGSSPGTYTVALPAGAVTAVGVPASEAGASASVTVASSR